VFSFLVYWIVLIAVCVSYSYWDKRNSRWN
jgi:hypothetical protein